MPINWDDFVTGASTPGRKSAVDWDAFVNPPTPNKPGFISDIKRGTGQVVEALGSTLQDIGAPETGEALERYGAGVVAKNPSQIQTVGEALANPFTTVREAVGEVVPQVASSVGTGLVGRVVGGALGLPFGPAGVAVGQTLGAGAGAYLGNLAQEYGGIRSEQRAQNIDDRGRALATGGAAAVLDTAFGAERIANKFLTKGSDILAREAGTSLYKHVGKQAAIGLGIESGTETAQTALERVGAYKDVTSAEALNEMGLAAIKGGIGGGAIRGGLAAISGEREPEGGSLLGGTDRVGNDVQQAFKQPDISAVTTTTEQPAAAATQRDMSAFMGGEGMTGANPLAGRASLYGQEQPPAVTGGQTEVAQAQTAAVAEQQAVQAAQQQQASRDEFTQRFGGVQTIDAGNGQVGYRFLNENYYTPQDLNAAIDKQLQKDQGKPDFIKQAESAYVSVFATPEKTPSPASVTSAMSKFTNATTSVGDIAARVNTELTSMAKAGKTIQDTRLSKLAEFYEALTGEVAPGYELAQQNQPKGTKNGKVQTTTGVGTVPVQGGAAGGATGLPGNLRPVGIQPVESGGQPAGQTGQQAGQPSAEGIRPGTGGAAPAGNLLLSGPGTGQGALNPGRVDEINTLIQQLFGGETPTGGLDETEATSAGEGGGEIGEPGKAEEPSVVTAVSQGSGGPRQYEIPAEYYNTDMMHIRPERRIEIITALLKAALEPEVSRDNALDADTRAEIVRLSLMEELTAPVIAAELGIGAEAVQGQRKRLGIVADKLGISVDTSSEAGQQFLARLYAAAEAYVSEEFPDGLGHGELAGLYSTKDLYYDKGKLFHVGEQLESEQKTRSTDVKLQEELRPSEPGAKDTQSMGTVKTAGGTQGYVDALKQTRKGVKDVSALDEIETLTKSLEGIAEDAPEREAVLAQITDLWTQYNKAQRMRDKAAAEAGVDIEQEEEPTLAELGMEGEGNAVQESSAEEVPVRQGARSGKAVGKGNAQEGKAAGAREAQAGQEVTVQTPKEQWNALAEQTPGMPAYEVLSKDERTRWDDLARRGVANLAAASRLLEAPGPVTIDVEARIIDETVKPQVLALPEPQVSRLERHYNLKRDSAEFLAKVKEDVVTYATKGAEAVAAAIRDVIKAIHAGLLSVAMIFNPTSISTPQAYVIVPKAEVETVERVVQAEVPAEARMMSEAGKKAYATLIPAMKGRNGDKLITIADKPSGRIFVFDANGNLILQKKALFGLAKGDLYKGNNDLPQNRVTPAGLFGLKLVDAAKGGGAAKTAGEYDFGKVFAFEDPDAVVTIMHSVWLKEKDAAQRAAALKSESAADSRFSFGCINVDKDTFKTLLDKYQSQMDGSKLFIVPDDQTKVKDFLEGAVPSDKLVRESVKPVTETVTRVKGSATEQATGRQLPGKEERGPMASKSKAFYDVGDLADAFDGVAAAQNQLEDLGIEHAMDYVSDWEIINDPSADAINGEIRSGGGRYTVVLNEAKLTSSNHAIETVTHEVGHAVDMAPHGGIYSSQPEMSVSVKDGKITPVGVVAREMFRLFNTMDNWREYLEYPFDTVKFPDIDNATKVEGELFAQVFSAYADPKARAALEKLAPSTAAFMAEVIKHVQSTKSLQIQKPETAAIRSLAFRNRNAGQRGQTNVAIAPRREQESLPSFSKILGPEPLTDRLPKPLKSASERITTDLLYQAKKGVLASAITEDVVNMATKYMRSAADYLKAQYARQALRLQHELRVEKVLQQYDRLPKELQGTGKGSVNEFIFDSTRSGLWGYYPGEKFVGTTLLNVDKGMKARFEAFPPAAQQLIRDVFDYGNEALRAKQKAVKDAIDREFAEREKAAIGDADLMEDLAKDKARLMKRESKLNNLINSKPYAYLGRYGDYVMVAKSKEYKHYEELAEQRDPAAIDWIEKNESDPAHYVVEFAETLSEAKAIANRLGATGMYDIPEAFEKEAYADYLGSSESYVAINRLRKLAAREFKGGDPVALKSIDKMLGDLYLITAAETSARKSMLQRKDISGADKDMMRNMATSGRANAHFLSTLQYNDEIADSIEKMRTERKYNNEEATPLFNELLKRHASSMKYETPGPISSFLTKTTSVWFLATSPAFYLQQLLQTYVLSLPYIAGRLGYFRSARAINTAYKDIAQLVKGMSLTEHIDFDSAPADVRSMLQTLVGMGKIDIGVDSDAKARAGERSVANQVLYKLQSLNTRIESINRATAAIAAYRGYLQRYGADKTDAATKFAAEVVSNTHGSYDGFNTPRIMQSGAGRVAFQFKRFQIIQLSMLAKLISKAFGNAPHEEKAVARKMLGFITAQMAAIGGVLAVPFVSQSAWILSKVVAALGDDEPEDPELMLRRWIGDQAVSDLILRGTTGAMGLETLGKKLGMENVASPFGPYAQIDMTSRAGAEKALVAMMGASAGLGLKMADAMGFMIKGDYYRGLEMALPNGLGNAMKGYRILDEGVTRRNKDVVLKPDEITVVDAAFQAVGLPTTTLTRQQFTQRIVAEQNKYYEGRASEIKTNYVVASRNGDTAAMAEARADWEELQASRKQKGYKTQPLSELFQALGEARKRERGVVGGVETTKSNKAFVQEVSRL